MDGVERRIQRSKRSKEDYNNNLRKFYVGFTLFSLFFAIKFLYIYNTPIPDLDQIFVNIDVTNNCFFSRRQT